MSKFLFLIKIIFFVYFHFTDKGKKIVLSILRHSGFGKALSLKIGPHVVFEFSDFNLAAVISIKTGTERIDT